jgi:hypothetical protein
MKRLHILVEEDLDETLEREARRTGSSKADLIREFIRERLSARPPFESDSLLKMLGQDDFDPASIDRTVYR